MPLFKGKENSKVISKTQARKTFLYQLRKIRKAYKEISPAGKTALIVLTVLVAILLSGFVAAAACTLACAGSTFLAVLVGIVGQAAIILGAVKLFQVILGKKKSNQELPTP
jgi:hypothetical protein